MDVPGFVVDLPRAFGGDVLAAHPVDRRFARVVDAVPGMTTEHTLTLLNLAVARMAPGEAYLEVGSYKGRSLAGALLDRTAVHAVAIESFREFGTHPDEGVAGVLATLREFGCADNVRFLRGDAFRLLDSAPGDLRVGVYFYDGAHSRVAQYLGLAMAEPLLADTALVVVDDASWPQVASATRSYVDRHPGYRLLFDLAAEIDFDPRWCNGVKVYGWQRPPGWRPARGFEVAWRRAAHLYFLDPARHLAWDVLPRYPRLLEGVRKLYLHGGTSVPERR